MHSNTEPEVSSGDKKQESVSEVRQTREKESGELKQMFSTDNLSSGRPDTLMFTGPDAMQSFRAAVAKKQQRICHILMLKADLTDTDMSFRGGESLDYYRQ
ncbi:MAG: hypothetical protein R3D26_13265 [Cyanobacteriota/Melainabacteria group bacterium]